MSKSNFDRQWFLDRLAENEKSIRGLARHLDVDVSAMSRMLSGQRKMKLSEANEIASFLSTTTNEVLAHAGVALAAERAALRTKLEAFIDEHGVLHDLPEPLALPQSILGPARAFAGRRGSKDISAAQIRATSGPLAVLDDAIVFFDKSEAANPSSTGSLAICISKSGEKIIGKIASARKTGEATIIGYNGDALDVELSHAARILIIIP